MKIDEDEFLDGELRRECGLNALGKVSEETKGILNRPWPDGGEYPFDTQFIGAEL